jgi:hypothetical protein
MTEPYEPPSAATPPPAGTGSGDDAWRRRNRTDRMVDTGAIIWGVILLAVGGWFFLDQTLGLDMPSIDWGSLWPVILIVVGGVVIIQGLGRRNT